MRRGDPSANRREDREQYQRHGHAVRRFVDVNFVLVVARLAEEREEDQPEHVERSESRAKQAEQPKQQSSVRGGTRGVQNFVLAEKTRESRDSGDCERGDKHRPERNGNFCAQAAHVGHFLVAAHGVNHAAGREEEQALEESVRHQVKDAGGVGPDSQAEKHVAELRDGGVGEDFLDVGLHQADGRGVEGGDGSDQRDDKHRERSARE